jgi:hypothetical protein
MTINANQLQVSKIYPGNYTNVLRYWHAEKTFQFRNANDTETTFSNQPIGGPVGVVFTPGWIAQQAIGYVDLSFQALGTTSQLEYYTQAYSSGLNGANSPFLNSAVIIPSPDALKDVRADITDGIKVPSGAYVYRLALRVDGGDVISSGVGGGSSTPTLGLGPAVGVGLNTTPSASGFFVTLAGSSSRITNGSNNTNNVVFDSTTLYRTSAEIQYKVFSVTNLGGSAASGLAQASGVFDPRASNGLLRGKNKALGICEVCWFLADDAPSRDDLALQPAGLVESNVYTSTVPA